MPIGIHGNVSFTGIKTGYLPCAWNQIIIATSVRHASLFLNASSVSDVRLIALSNSHDRRPTLAYNPKSGTTE
jgi:hypothetical protein